MMRTQCWKSGHWNFIRNKRLGSIINFKQKIPSGGMDVLILVLLDDMKISVPMFVTIELDAMTKK